MAPLYCHLEVHTHRPRRRSIDRLSGWEEPSVYYPTARLPIARPQPIDPTYDVIERESQKHEETVGFERAMFLIDVSNRWGCDRAFPLLRENSTLRGGADTCAIV